MKEMIMWLGGVVTSGEAYFPIHPKTNNTQETRKNYIGQEGKVLMNIFFFYVPEKMGIYLS